jgi:hypothetical protein
MGYNSTVQSVAFIAFQGENMTQEVAQGAEASPETQAQVPAEQTPEQQPANPTESDGERKKLGGWQRKLMKKDQTIAELMAENQALKSVQAPQAPKEPPKPENFQTTDEYNRSMISHYGKEEAERVLKDRDVKAAQERDQQTLRSKVQKYELAKEEIRSRHPDFDDALAEYEGPESPQILMALLDTEAPADVAYFLAKHPDEAQKMQGMKAHEVNRHLAKIEARIELEKSQAKAPKTTNAPPPVNPVKATAKTDNGPPEDPDEYRAWWWKNKRGK